MGTFYITKYALTSGIMRVEADEPRDAMLVVRGNGRGTFDAYFHGEGKDWHRTADAALARSEEARQAKIASLKKSIVKLMKLQVRIPPAPAVVSSQGEGE